MTKDPAFDLAIIGAGLAGCCLAWQAWWRGLSVCLFDAVDCSADRQGSDEAIACDSASSVAAGLVTPVQGQRFATPAHFDEELATVDRFYTRCENETHSSFWQSEKSIRLFRSEERVERFQKRLINSAQTERDLNPQVETMEPSQLPVGWRSDWGGFAMPNARRLRVTRFRRATMRHAQQSSGWQTKLVNAATDLDQSERFVHIRGHRETFGRVVFCTGTAIHQSPWTTDLQCRYAGGEILLAKLIDPSIAIRRILIEHSAIHHDGWCYLLREQEFERPLIRLSTRKPVTEEELRRECNDNDLLVVFGATYHDSCHLVRESESGISELCQRFGNSFEGPFEPLAVGVGTRPIISGRKPIVRWTGDYDRIGFLGGLASHGVRTGPIAAAELLDRIAVDGSCQ
jgi:glycine/D-amino acid oxidase-like deaminating enzyme